MSPAYLLSGLMLLSAAPVLACDGAQPDPEKHCVEGQIVQGDYDPMSAVIAKSNTPNPVVAKPAGPSGIAVDNKTTIPGVLAGAPGYGGSAIASAVTTLDKSQNVHGAALKIVDPGDHLIPPVADNGYADKANALSKSEQAALDEAKRLALQNNPSLADVKPIDFVQANAGQDKTPGMAPVWNQVADLTRSGDNAGALAEARKALEQHPDDVHLQAFVQLSQKQDAARTASTEKTVKDRAKELIASLRGDPEAAAPPPGAAILASPLAFATPNMAETGRALPQTALTAAGIAPRDPAAMRYSGPVRDAASKVAIRDFPGAEVLLTRRIEEVPSDEPALRLRAFARRQMKKYEPSATDAKSALTLAPWDTRARRVLIDDDVDMGRSAEALDEADRALQEMPHDPQLFAARANVYASMGDHENQLADLKQAAALDSQFDQLYEQAVMAGNAPVSRRPRSGLVWLGAVGTALLFFSFALFRKRGDTSMRLAMRADDHALLARGARPEAAPAGFRIIKTLGQGGMGVVYEAMDLGLQRTVALKKLRSEIADSPRERTRFLKEARTVAALKHPNIVEIHAIHEDAEGLFLVFEKVDGESLHERLGKGALRPGEAVGYLRQIAMALDHAHSAGVVHQDLKPANIMVAGDRAKVMDFGIARRVQETMSTLSRVEVAGTPAYMAPEQEMGGAVGPAADVFALGACTYELLTGRTPFPHGGMMMKAEKKFRPASEVAPSLPKGADAVLARALEPDPAARWPSAASFVEALAKSLS